MYQLESRGAVEYIGFPGLEKSGVRAVFSTRRGGVSTGRYSSLNLAPHVGDCPERVRENRRRLSVAVGVSGAWVTAEQLHGDRVAIVRDSGSTGDAPLPGVDALVTDRRGLVLATLHADCVPLYILDPVRGVIGLAHAGWGGSLLGVGPRTLRRMKEECGVEPRDCSVVIGPSIGPCCYEVGPEVMECLRASFTDWRRYLRARTEKGGRLDLWLLNHRQLIASGIKEESIYVSRLCTCCHRELFYSYRGEQGITGRMAALLVLR